MRTTVIPAYGREYTTAKAAKADWEAGKDFILMDCSSQWDGRYFNKESAKDFGYTEVNIRFKGKTKVTTVKL